MGIGCLIAKVRKCLRREKSTVPNATESMNSRELGNAQCV